MLTYDWTENGEQVNSSQRFGNHVAQDRVHMDSLIIGQTEFHRWKSFVVGMATKIAATTQTAIEAFFDRQSLTPTPEQARAIRSLGSR